tara:strand:- start:3301 stop:3534 length:234 start_codon:yes stop_codon:yes gene_type:complete
VYSYRFLLVIGFFLLSIYIFELRRFNYQTQIWINEFNQLSTLDLCMEDEIKDRISNFRICFENLKDIFDRSIVDLVT